MGQASRRKAKNAYPEQTAKRVKVTRVKVDPLSIGYCGMGMMMSLLSGVLTSKQLGRNFAMRSKLARVNQVDADT
jgi:hypothetical protein